LAILSSFIKSIFGPTDTHGSSMAWVFTFGGLFIPIITLWNSRAIVPLVVLMALSSLAIIIKTRHQRPPPKWDKYLIVGVCFFLASILLSAYQVSNPQVAMISAGKIFSNVFIAITLIYAVTFLNSEDVIKVTRCIFIGACIVGGFLLYDVLTKGDLSLLFKNMTYTYMYKFFWFKSAAAVFTTFTMIAAFYLALKNKIWVSLLLLGLAVFITIGVGNRTAAIGIIIALLVGITYQLIGRWRHKALSGLLILAFTVPFYVLSFGVTAERISQIIFDVVGTIPAKSKMQTRHKQNLDFEVPTSASLAVAYRMYVWEFVIERILERPVQGWGLKASKQFGGEDAEIIIDPNMGTLGEPVPLHPHNGILQVWLELGAIGALSLLFLILRATYLLDQKCRSATNRIWTFSILALLMCFFAFSYSVFSSAWLALAIFTFAMLNALSATTPKQTQQTENIDIV